MLGAPSTTFHSRVRHMQRLVMKANLFQSAWNLRLQASQLVYILLLIIGTNDNVEDSVISCLEMLTAPGAPSA